MNLQIFGGADGLFPERKRALRVCVAHFLGRTVMTEAFSRYIPELMG